MVALLGNNDVQIIAADDVFTDNGGNDAVSRLAHNDFFFGFKNFAVSRCCQPFAEVKKAHVEQLPMPKIRSAAQQKLHNEIVKLVEQMLAAQPKARAALSDSDKNFHERFIASLEQRINQAVYQIYGLTADEIALIEAAA